MATAKTTPAKSSSKKEDAAARPPLPQPSYPTLEAFIEKANAADISAAFKDLKGQVDGLKGPKAEQGKKIQKAIERTEELLSYLLQVREKLEAERKGKGGGRK